MKIALTTVLLAAATLVQGLNAADIPIPNFSFENPVLTDGQYREGIPGWTTFGTITAANPGNDWFTNTTDGASGPNPIDGRNVALVNSGSTLSYQPTNLVIGSNATFTLKLLVGHRLGGVPLGTPTISLEAAGQRIALADFTAPAAGSFIEVTLQYIAPESGFPVGSPLQIVLKSAGSDAQAAFDNVRLSVTDGPVACTPHKGAATAQLLNGIFVGATLTDTGCGYTNAPVVLIQGGGGTGATARALINDGRITEIRVTNGGCCYTNAPRVVIGSPPFVPSVGIEVSKVNVTQNVVLGWKYVLESSTNAIDWTPTGPPFVAESESIVTEFSTESPARHFRLRVAP